MVIKEVRGSENIMNNLNVEVGRRKDKKEENLLCYVLEQRNSVS